MKKNILLICSVLLSLFFFTEVGHAACAIEQGPPQQILEYRNQISTELSRIRSQAGNANRCNGQQGTFTSERRFLDTLKRVDESISWPDVINDFFYNVTFTSEGGSRGPVTAQGAIWKEIEKQAIQTMQSVATICALDSPLSGGGTPDARITRIIENNRKLEKYFWQIAMGNEYTTPPEGIESYTSVLDAIRANYNLEVTRVCKGPNISEDVISGITDRLSKLGASNATSHKNWQDAVDLFRGAGKNTKKYIELEQRLLQAELSRQGLSTNAKKAILTRMGCLAQRTDDKSTPEEISRRQKECEYILVAGLDNLTVPLKKLIEDSRTTDQYLERTLQYDAEKYRISTDMGSMWSLLEKETTVTDTATNQTIINDLVSMHYKLVSITSALEKAIPEAYDYCMRGGKDTACPRP